MLYTGEPISAEEALRIGIVSHVKEDLDELERWANEVAEKICSLPQDALALGKHAFLRQSQMRLSTEAMEFASDIMVDNLGLENTKEGLKAFAEKRHPKFKN